MSLGIKFKGPDETIHFAMDWSDWLDTDRDGTADDTIASVTWTLGDGLTEGLNTNTTTVATVAVSGGTIGKTYRATCQMTTTTSGETFQRFGLIEVVDR